MRWRYRMIAVLLCVSMLCGGCFGAQEVDDVSFVLTIGVDESNEPGLYVFTFRIAMPRAFTGDSGGGDNDKKTKLVSVKAPTITNAVRQLAVAMNRQPELSHVSAFFVHESIAKQGVYDFVSLFMRSKIYRNTMVVLVTREPVKEVMEKNTSPFELFQYRWVDSLKRTQKFASGYLINNIREFYVDLSAPQAAALATYGSIQNDSLEKQSLPSLEHQAVPQLTAENFPRAGGTELIAVGSAVFQDWKMTKMLTSNEAFGANLLSKGVQTMYAVPDPEKDGEWASIGLETRKPRIEVRMERGKMVVDIKLKAIFELIDASSNVDYTKGEKRKVLEQRVAAAIRSNLEAYFRATQPLGADCVQLSDHYRTQVGSWQEWTVIDWPQAYKDAEIRLDVQAKLTRASLLWRYIEGGKEG